MDPIHAPASASEARALIAEKDTAGIRLAIIVFNVVLYLGFMTPIPGRATLALTIVVVAMVYALYIAIMRPYERVAVLRTAWYTLATDSGLIILWIYATGGIASPFYPLWALSLLAILFRFGADVTANATALYMLLDLGTLAYSGDVTAANTVAIAARLAYIAIIGTLATLIGHRWSEAIEQRTLAEQALVHEQRLAREAENLQVLVAATFEGIVVHRDGVIVTANPAFCRIADVEPRFIEGARLRDLLSVPEAAFDPEGTHSMSITRRGQEMLIELQSRAIEYHGEHCMLTAIRDVTQSKRADEARQLAETRRIEITRLESLERLRTDFINSVAHELNTPLTPLKLQLSMMAADHPDEGRNVEIMRRNVDRLARVVSDMLDVTRMQRGQFELHPRTVDLVPLIQDVAEQFQAAGMRKEVALDVLVPERLPSYVDPHGVRQALAGFISHALQASDPGAAITIVARDVSEAARVEVIDSGKGMTQDQIDAMFEPFGELHGDPKVPGTGLGLHLAKGIIEQSGGRVGCESDGPGRGARRWLELPRDEAALEAPKTRMFMDPTTS